MLITNHDTEMNSLFSLINGNGYESDVRTQIFSGRTTHIQFYITRKFRFRIQFNANSNLDIHSATSINSNFEVFKIQLEGEK